MGHLLAMTDWDRPRLEAFFPRAQAALEALEGGPAPVPSRLAGRWLANLFFEDSTRTRLSFETAATSLGMRVANWSEGGSSVSKGESLPDTIRSVDAMGPAAIVIRHPQSGAPGLVARYAKAVVINAGDGTHEHPSQALLDTFTLWKRWGSFEGRRVAIVGDVLHSRVARSNLTALRTLGAEVVLVAPPSLLPAGVEEMGASTTSDFDAILPEVDAVMMLRLQIERQKEAFFPSVRDYGRRFSLTEAREKTLKPEALVLHPGPMNRGVEIASAVADGPRSLVLSQVTYGVAVRRALLEVLL
ncbi:MAG TPA: aspartate carbamoyltransferase catalytic subunit [Myxococcaceae bacterium]|nr:aspartate carbamoyltransferase catalytic subunit [Myxococcaceae bacterium]